MDDVRTPVTPVTAGIFEHAFAVMVDRLDPEMVALGDATDVWSAFDRIERLAAAAKTLLAARVDDAGGWRRAGARSAAEHMAKLGGTSKREARRALVTSRLVAELPAVAAAMRAGGLSSAQVGAVVGAAAADPSAQDRLVALAATTNVNELREECLRTTAAADPDRDATYRRIEAERTVRIYTDAEGAGNLVARGPVDRVARIEAALKPLIDGLYDTARLDGRHEPREAYAFDALLAFAERDPTATEPDDGKRRTNPKYLAVLHADIEALVRGEVDGEEKCEIVGLGPIPVRTARDLLGESILKLVITKGVDVANVVHLGRGPTAAQRIAMLWTSPKCSNIACSSTYVQYDHRDPWADTHHTVLGELDPLCPYDHKLKTDHGWALVEGKGRRAFVGPDDPRHPRNRPPP